MKIHFLLSTIIGVVGLILAASTALAAPTFDIPSGEAQQDQSVHVTGCSVNNDARVLHYRAGSFISSDWCYGNYAFSYNGATDVFIECDPANESIEFSCFTPEWEYNDVFGSPYVTVSQYTFADPAPVGPHITEENVETIRTIIGNNLAVTGYLLTFIGGVMWLASKSKRLL